MKPHWKDTAFDGEVLIVNGQRRAWVYLAPFGSARPWTLRTLAWIDNGFATREAAQEYAESVILVVPVEHKDTSNVRKKSHDPPRSRVVRVSAAQGVRPHRAMRLLRRTGASRREVSAMTRRLQTLAIAACVAIIAVGVPLCAWRLFVRLAGGTP